MAMNGFHALAAMAAAAVVLSTGMVAAQQPPAPPLAPAAKQATPPADATADLRRRVEQLEEQLVDLQVVLGTLESLARTTTLTGAAASRPSSLGGEALSAGDSTRLDGLETQIRALTSQLEQLSQRPAAAGEPTRRSDLPAPSFSPVPGQESVDRATAPSEPFGSTTVNATERDFAAGSGPGDHTAAATIEAGPPAAPLDAGPGLAAGASPANPKQLYETAYGYLLQPDYASAERTFSEFLQQFPNDSLSGNAQYWLGETHFVRGQYKAAASAFLKGYETYGKSAKAPDSLLKLAMSLDRLGQKDAACSSYSELATRFPDAAPHLKSRAQTERQRVGCP